MKQFTLALLVAIPMLQDSCNEPCPSGNGTPVSVYSDDGCNHPTVSWEGVSGYGELTITVDPASFEDVEFRVEVDGHLVTDWINAGGDGASESIVMSVDIENSLLVDVFFDTFEEVGAATVLLEDSVGICGAPEISVYDACQD